MLQQKQNSGINMKRKKVKVIKSHRCAPDMLMQSYQFTPDMPIPEIRIPLRYYDHYVPLEPRLKIPKYHGDK